MPGARCARRWGNGPLGPAGGRPSHDGVTESRIDLAPSIKETTMEHYAGIDVSLECSSVCVVDGSGKIVRETKVESEPAWFPRLSAWADRVGSRTAVAMALYGNEAGRACGRAFGDAARA